MRLLVLIAFLCIAVNADAQLSSQPALESGAILDVQSIRFAENSAVLHDSTKAAVQKVVKIMTAFPNTHWKIEGTALLVEREPETLALQRANAVKGVLVKSGIDPARMNTSAQVDTSPKLPMLSLLELAERRRVELIVLEEKK